MGLTHSLAVRGAPDLGRLLDGLASAGLPSAILMIDNQLVPPSASPPAQWRDVRLKTPAGTLALKLDGGQVHLIVFGNADGPLLAARDQIARLLSERS